MTKEQLRNYIKRQFGYPLVKVELTNDQIEDSIDYAAHKFSEWATENANEEVFFTIPLSAGQSYYDLPNGVITIVDYSDSGGRSTGGVNTLFTVENFLYSMGYYPTLSDAQGSLLNYHMVLDFLNTLERYVVNQYVYKYHKFSNQLQLIPTPTQTGQFVLIHAFVLTGSMSPGWDETQYYEWLYGKSWVRNYAIALSKEKLGYIRRKFGQFDSIGNTGIKLDGEQLVQEAKEELDKLSESLTMEYSYEGYGIELS